MISRLRQVYGIWKLARALGSPWLGVWRASTSRAAVTKLATRHGVFTVRPRNSDLHVLAQVFVHGDYNFRGAPQYAAVEAYYFGLLARGHTPIIIDAGANIGAAAIWFADRFPQAQVIAVEPDPENAALARSNCKEHPTITLLEAAIGAEPGWVMLANGKDAWAVRTQRSDHGLRVVTIAEAAEQVSDGALFIVKIDIEGFEADLFTANTEWIDQAYAIFVEPHDWMLPGEGSSQSMQRALLGRGREILIVGENLLFIQPGKGR